MFSCYGSRNPHLKHDRSQRAFFVVEEYQLCEASDSKCMTDGILDGNNFCLFSCSTGPCNFLNSLCMNCKSPEEDFASISCRVLSCRPCINIFSLLDKPFFSSDTK